MDRGVCNSQAQACPRGKKNQTKPKQSCAELSRQLPRVGNGHIDLSLLLFPYLQ